MSGEGLNNASNGLLSGGLWGLLYRERKHAHALASPRELNRRGNYGQAPERVTSHLQRRSPLLDDETRIAVEHEFDLRALDYVTPVGRIRRYEDGVLAKRRQVLPYALHIVATDHAQENPPRQEKIPSRAASHHFFSFLALRREERPRERIGSAEFSRRSPSYHMLRKAARRRESSGDPPVHEGKARLAEPLRRGAGWGILQSRWAMDSTEAAQKALEFIRDRLLLVVAIPLSELTPPLLWRWRHEAHILHHFVAVALGEELARHTEGLLATSAGLWRLLNDHADALSEIHDYERARGLSAVSDLAGITEEILSGEDETIRDVLLDAAMFYLNWKSNTYWVDAGKKSHRAMARGYLLEIQEELWEFLRQSSGAQPSTMTMEEAIRIGESADKLVRRLAEENTPTPVQVALLAFLYQWILRLRMGRLLVSLEGRAPTTTPSGER